MRDLRLWLLLFVSISTLAGLWAVGVPAGGQLGFIWQGGYSMPFVVVVPILAGWIVGQHWPLERPWLVRGLTALAPFFAVSMFASIMITLSRFAEGSTDPSVFGFIGEQSWQPRGGPWIYVVLGLVAAVGYGAAILQSARTATRQGAIVTVDM